MANYGSAPGAQEGYAYTVRLAPFFAPALLAIIALADFVSTRDSWLVE